MSGEHDGVEVWQYEAGPNLEYAWSCACSSDEAHAAGYASSAEALRAALEHVTGGQS